MTDKTKPDTKQGEGDRESAERYNEATRDFVDSGKVDDAPDPAGQPEEAAEWAERKGKSRARELDPEVHRDYQKPTDRT